MPFYRTYCHVSLAEFSPISVMTSWPVWAAMAGGHNRRGSTEGVGHARRSWNAVRDDYPRPSLAESAARALPFPKSQRPTCPFSFAPGGTPPARPSATSASARCEPVPAFPLLPEPSACPAWPSATSASARCEPIPANRLTPASRGSGSWPGAMAAGAREQTASCDAFVLSRRLPAPDAPPIRTSPLCLIAKALPDPRPGDLWPGRDCRREFRQARSRTPIPDSVLAVGGMTDGVWQGGSVMSTPRRGPCRAFRHDRGRRNSSCAPPCACCRRRP